MSKLNVNVNVNVNVSFEIETACQLCNSSKCLVTYV
jgi:hypothetical protein